MRFGRNARMSLKTKGARYNDAKVWFGEFSRLLFEDKHQISKEQQQMHRTKQHVGPGAGKR